MGNRLHRGFDHTLGGSCRRVTYVTSAVDSYHAGAGHAFRKAPCAKFRPCPSFLCDMAHAEGRDASRYAAHRQAFQQLPATN